MLAKVLSALALALKRPCLPGFIARLSLLGGDSQ